MKKIIGLLLVSMLLSTTAFAQERAADSLPGALRALGDARVLTATPDSRKTMLADVSQHAGTSTAKRDGLANGIWIGLLVGLGVGAATIPIACPHDAECQNVYAVVIVPIYAAGGAVVGALIDRAVTDPPQTAQVSLGHSRFRLAASASRAQRSVMVGVGF